MTTTTLKRFDNVFPQVYRIDKRTGRTWKISSDGSMTEIEEP